MNKLRDESEKMYECIENIISEYANLSKSFNDFEKKWDVTIIPKDKISPNIEEVGSELINLKPQIMRITKKCIVFGKTTVGKSTFINALLKENILPSCFGSTSTTFIEIKASPKTYNYIVVDGSNEEHEINEISRLNDEIDLNSTDRPNIHLFYDRQSCELLKENVVIIDTPGTDNDAFQDRYIEDLCKEADVIILLVNATGVFSLSDKTVISKHKTIFSKLTVLVVYTWWDVVHVTDPNGSIKQKQFENVKSFLCGELNYSEETARKSIYFLSGKERLEMVSRDSIVPSTDDNELRSQRNKSFDVFIQVLNRKLSENAYQRIYRYLDQVYSNTSRTVRNSESYLIEKCFVKELVKKINLNLSSEDDMNIKINKEITDILAKGFDKLIQDGIGVVNIGNEKKTNQGYESINVERKERQNEELKTLFVKIIKESLSEIQCNIIKLFSDENENKYSMRKQILQEFYFKSYLDVENQIDSFDINLLESNLLEIKEKIRTGTISTICATVGFSLLTVVTGGASLIALGLAEIGLAAGAAITAGGIAGASFGGGTSFGIIKAIKNPFGVFWRDIVKKILTLCYVFQLALLNSYSSFIDNLESDVLQLFTPFLTDFRNIENKLNAFKEDLKCFINLSLIT